MAAAAAGRSTAGQQASFAHLHVHTEYSMLDGAARLKDLFRQCEQAGMPAIAMTDHGNVYGAYDFWTKATAAGIKPVIGIEAYVAPEHRMHRQPVRWGTPGQSGDDISGAGAYTHMTLLAETTEGMHNLFRLSSRASLEGFFRKPRMDRELLAAHANGLIATTGCPSGEVQTRLRLGQYRQALDAAADYRDIFGQQNFFVEIMDHGLDIERRVRDGLRKIAAELGAPVRRHQRLALHPPRRRAGARGAALRADRVQPRRPGPVQVRGQRLLRQDPRPRCARSPPTRSGRPAATRPCSSPSGATSPSPSRT